MASKAKKRAPGGWRGGGVRDIISSLQDLFYANGPLLSLDNNLKRSIPIILL